MAHATRPRRTRDHTRAHQALPAIPSATAASQERRCCGSQPAALRSFLHHARYRADLILDLAAAVPTVAHWSMASLPRSLPPDHVERVLAQCNRQTAIGRRDYAILLLLARLGLRAGEVVSLRLEDIDWDAGCVTVRGTGGHWTQSPSPSRLA